MVTLRTMLSNIACEVASEYGGRSFLEFADRVEIVFPALGALARCFASRAPEGFPDYVLDWPDRLIVHAQEVAGLSPAGARMWFDVKYGGSRW